jgi:CRISPR-associated endonuclease/helicase Cas3
MLAALAFAIRHAVANKLRRIIYAAPFTTIIEQNAQVYRDAVGETNVAAVLEHHGATDIAAETVRERLAAENWDAPFVVTPTFTYSSRFSQHHRAVAERFTASLRVPPDQLLLLR